MSIFIFPTFKKCIFKEHTFKYSLTIEKKTAGGPDHGQSDHHHNTNPEKKSAQPTLENNHRKIIM